MMRSKLKIALVFLIFNMMIAVGCSNNDNADDNKLVDSREKVEVIMSAAVSLTDALADIKNAYEAENQEVSLIFNFGASGSLQQQISEGAPVDIFFSAAEDKYDLLVKEGLIAEEDGGALLGNSLALIVAKDRKTSITSFEDLASDEVTQLAFGIPETVPVGKYTKESLEYLGIWDQVEPKVVFAKDARQVLSYVGTENVEAGVVYKTDAAVSDRVTVVAEADPSTHTPVIYPVGVMKDAKNYDAAKDFYNYLLSDAALKVFEEYGFYVQ